MADHLPTAAEVVVIGAGLAGLATAHHLESAGLAVTVLERAEDVGGRVRTDNVDGFRLDHGFQLYNPAYPEGRAVFDHAALDLRGFERGARVVSGTRTHRLGDPRVHPTWALESLRGGLVTTAGLAAFAAYAVGCARATPASLRARPDLPIRDALTAARVPAGVLDDLVRPFLSGVFLETDLATSRRYADLVLRSFVRGTPAVPALGMAELPRQLAGRCADVHTGTEVTGIAPGVVRTVHGSVRADAVVVATDARAAARLVPGYPEPVGMNSCTTWYFVPDQPPTELADGLGILTVDADPGGPVVNTAVLTNAAPSYAPPGRSLVAATAVGLAAGVNEDAVRTQLSRLYSISTAGWEGIGVYHISDALPRALTPFSPQRPVTLGDGLFTAGDHLDTPSIQGALVSGRRAAAAVREHLGR